MPPRSRNSARQAAQRSSSAAAENPLKRATRSNSQSASVKPISSAPVRTGRAPLNAVAEEEEEEEEYRGESAPCLPPWCPKLFIDASARCDKLAAAVSVLVCNSGKRGRRRSGWPITSNIGVELRLLATLTLTLTPQTPPALS